MFKYNNTHIFTGYLKQLLSSFNLPTCRIYTNEFANYLEQHGVEDPRVLESFDNTFNITAEGVTINKHTAKRINYLKNNELYNYFWSSTGTRTWRRSADVFYTPEKANYGLTRTLSGESNGYDTVTHEYLGDYLRFIRDYYNINLMSLYNCFNNKLYNNIYFTHTHNSTIKTSSGEERDLTITRVFNSQDSNYRIYAIPVKLFSEYTIAIDCDQGVEMFCGFYKTTLELTEKATRLADKTYVKKGKTLFKQPFLYDKLSVKNWPVESSLATSSLSGKQQLPRQIRTDEYTRWDLAAREQDLRLIIKVPISCRSSITILEGNYVGYNDTKFEPIDGKLVYNQNHSVLNFDSKVDLNNYPFKPISKLQLLAFNTGESYPFADRLVEYLAGSAVTPIDPIPDNIKRAQKVMEQNKNYFKIEGLWEDKMQNILYDYMINSGPIEAPEGKLRDKRQGLHRRLGHTSKSTLYDVLGYVDKDAEKWYSSWKIKDGAAVVKDNIQNVDIYDGLFDI